jgi:hypothetical protein
MALTKMLNKLFTRLDIEGDGEISRTELHEAAHQLGWHWPEAPLFAVLDLLTVKGPISRDRFATIMQRIQNDPLGPYGKVLLQSPVFTAACRISPRDSQHRRPVCDTALPVKAHAISRLARAQDRVTQRIAEMSGAEVARAYQSTRARLDTVRITANEAAVLIIDPQQSFTHGAWMKSIGAGGERDVVPIQIAFDHCKTLLQHYYGQIEMFFTRCPFPPKSYGWEQGLAKILDHDQIYLLKPGNSVFFPPSNGYKVWVEQRMAEGMRTLVMGGCTFNSCVRVSAIETQQWFRAEGLQVVVDWELSGARACNYMPSAQYNGLSAVADAIEQMRGAGVKVVQAVAWQ